jgi:hypothetical protein
MSRFAKFLEKKFKVQSDNMGIPSIIIVDGEEQNLIQSIDRKRMLSSMTLYLINTAALPEDMAKQTANDFLDTKYKEYMDFVMKL